MIHIDNNAMIAAVKTTYDMLTEREKIIYNLGYRTGLKSNEKPFKFVPDTKPIHNEKVYDLIIDTVCKHFKIKKSELFSKIRLQYLVIPRSMAINLIRELTAFSYPQIANLTDRDHTSLLYHIQLRINKMVYWKDQNNHSIYNQLKETINETIKKL